MVSRCRVARWRKPASKPKLRPRGLFDAGASGVVVKAQIHAGGRGKGGGVKIAKSVAEAAELAGKILGHDAGHSPDRTRGPLRAAVA